MKKRHSIRILLAAAALLLATAACTKDELADGDRLPEGQYPLEIARITLGVEGGEAQPWGAPRRQHRDSHLHRAGRRYSHLQRTPLLERP